MKSKSIYFILLCFIIPVIANAQLDRSKMPVGKELPKVNIGEYKQFTTANGIKVLVIENHKLPKVSVSVNLDISPELEKDAVGTSFISGKLLQTGTKNRTKAQIDNQIDFMGAFLQTNSSGMFGSSMKQHLNQLLDIMSDVLLNPVFPQTELDKEVKQMISGLAMNKSNAKSIAENVSRVMRFGKNHPYGEIITEESLKNITIEKCKKYYQSYFRPNVAYLIFIGDITLDEAKKATEKFFSAWQKADVPVFKYDAPKLSEGTRVCFIEKPGLQSYVNITYPIDLKLSNTDYITSTVVNTYLGGDLGVGRLIDNLREKHGYTYGARSSMNSNRRFGNFEAFSNVKAIRTDSSVFFMLDEMKQLITKLPDEAQLTLVKNERIGNFARSVEHDQSIANYAINTIYYNLPTDFYSNYIKSLGKITADDFKKAAMNYIKPNNAYIVVVGPKEIAESLKQFSFKNEIEYYDFYGNPIKKDNNELPKNVTSQSVITNYINAIGGIEKLSKIQNLSITGKFDVNGQEGSINFYKKASTKFTSILQMGEMVQKQVFNGEKGWIVAQEQREMSAEEINRFKINSYIFKELFYDKIGVKHTLTGVENVDGKKAYCLEITMPDGNKTNEFFDVTTGLKLKSVSTQKRGEQTMTIIMTYFDYKDVDGIKFPYKTTQDNGRMPLTIEVSNIDTKTVIDDKNFVVE